jgi:hypothetical protein
MKKLILSISIGIVCTVSASAQNDIDAMRYSQLSFKGTARFAAMGGSMSALGGDISCLSFNPAGIAVYRKTELSITPYLNSSNTSSTYNGMNSGDRKLNFNMSSIGLVATIHLKEDNNSGWKNLNFGFGYNGSSNFNSRTSIMGYNKASSLLDTYVGAANGTTSSSFDLFSTNLAYQTYLINPISATDTTHYNHVIPNYGELQKKTVESSGSMGETDISFGGNYKDKVFIGGTIGIVNVKYIESSSYSESDNLDTINGFKSFTLSNSLTTRGTGYNFKMGVIVNATDWLHVGAAIHTPTQIKLTDNHSATMNSDLDNGVTYSQDSPKGKYNYSLTTPFRAIGSLGFVIKKTALINVEYEYLDYSYAQLHSSDAGVFSDVNASIRDKYTSTGNFRIGGEYRMDPFAFRVGYALYGSPFKAGDNMNASRKSISTGIGFREKNYFIDLAYVYTYYTEYNYLYDSPNLNSVQTDYTGSSFMITFGVKFGK